MYGGIGKHVQAFQPSRSLSAIMNNKVIIDSQYFHLETMLRSRDNLKSIYKSPKYDDDIKTWNGVREWINGLRSFNQNNRIYQKPPYHI